ncbi:hypothetical protein GGQ08_000760 [Salinibacter ruber]|uniref:DUF3108 domain-containing protein n=1 Tax=Salinibacter ruber TaxID=146919 RepID=UPI0021690D92|nr:DUF3108 domain-containing protein [Salinibacter ruber]MCS3649466.1 hypothetical protein [Salinibacter ruber]MCS3652720.1 hypothetical protein [Salinibacter ruber]
MSRLLFRCVLALFFAAFLSAAATVPAVAQGPDGPSGDTDGFEKIDGTKLAPATLSYDATMKIDGRPRDLSSTQTFARTATGGADTWTLVNKIETPGGLRTDSLIVDRSSLLPISRHLRGRVVMDLAYTGPSTAGGMAASGTMKRRGQSKPISTDLDGPTLAGGVHDVVAFGAMPLEPGFRAALRVFSPQDQSVKRAEFEVTGTETVETPAGTFETYVVDLNVGDGYITGTVHLRKTAPRYYVKWATEVTTGQGTRTIRQTLSSMEMQASPDAK